MALFFDKFPIVRYDINKDTVTNLENITNITFRIGVVKEVLNNIAAYYEYVIQDGDTPEILADKVYSTPEAHWLILYANNIYDPQYDWPLTSKQLTKYIIGKYGSIENAKTTIHHYEKVMGRQETNQEYAVTRFVIDYDKKTDNAMLVTYDYYLGLPETQSVETFNLGNGKTITQITARNAISNYDYEQEENEKKRFIKIIKKEYYKTITDEFNNLTETEPTFLRRLF